MWMLYWAVANKKIAERILKEKGASLSEEERQYLMHVIAEGRRAGRQIRACEKQRSEEATKCKDAVEELNSKVLETFGGSTVYDAEGCWISEETGETECEPVKVIEVGHHCTDRETAKKLIQAIKDYAVKAKQYSVAVSQGSFYIAETEELVKAFEKQFSK